MLPGLGFIFWIIVNGRGWLEGGSGLMMSRRVCLRCIRGSRRVVVVVVGSAGAGVGVCVIDDLFF